VLPLCAAEHQVSARHAVPFSTASSYADAYFSVTSNAPTLYKHIIDMFPWMSARHYYAATNNVQDI
jgi:hypothetical protein